MTGTIANDGPVFFYKCNRTVLDPKASTPPLFCVGGLDSLMYYEDVDRVLDMSIRLRRILL